MFDPVRKKEVADTPEEKVRQTLISHLHNVCGAPYTIMSCEYGLKAGRKPYRADLVLFDKKGQPLLLAECKAPSVPIDRSVFEQIMQYNKLLKVPFLLLTNGVESYFCRHYHLENRLEALTQIPSYHQMILDTIETTHATL
jgi:type I site-specific restriction endonuclease